MSARAASAQKILEAGPGTGAVTGCIIERMRRDDQLWMVELNPTFAAHLRSAFKEKPLFRDVAERCHLVEGSVQQLGPMGALAGHGQFDLVISGLPLNNFSSEDVRDILQAYSTLLKPGGILSFFQYILLRPAKMFVSVGLRTHSAERGRRGHRRDARRKGIRPRMGLAERPACLGASHSVLTLIGEEGRGEGVARVQCSEGEV